VNIFGLPARSPAALLGATVVLTAGALALAAPAAQATGGRSNGKAAAATLITLSSAGSAKVTVPAVGEVRLELSKTGATKSVAAATALKLDVTVQPLNLNVAKVTGEVVLVEATCQTPVASASTGGSNSTGGSAGSGSGGATGAASSGSGGSASSGFSGTQTAAGGNLAETGSGSSTLLLAVGAGALILAGGGSVYMTRGRKTAAPLG
jgi:LPXTG-motif cell wall-anchored protein